MDHPHINRWIVELRITGAPQSRRLTNTTLVSCSAEFTELSKGRTSSLPITIESFRQAVSDLIFDLGPGAQVIADGRLRWDPISKGICLVVDGIHPQATSSDRPEQENWRQQEIVVNSQSSDGQSF